MKTLFATVLMIGLMSLTACQTAPAGDAKTGCAMCEDGKPCPMCAAGEACPMCADGKVCPDCKDGEKCEACAAGKPCPDCAAKHSEPGAMHTHHGEHAHATAEVAAEPAATEGTETATLTVNGLSCPLCANNTDLTLKKIPGVKQTKTDLAAGQITVWYDPQQKPTQQQFADAIADAGFTLVTEDQVEVTP